MKLVFCGTPQFAVPTLLALIDGGHEIALVLTQPDRPSGRGMQLVAPPVKQMAEAAGLDIFQPEKIKNNQELRDRLTAIAPDAIIVVAYGRIIPKWMLDLPRFGNINLHGSLLPKYRGAAPIQWAIARGETVTGVTTMRLDEGLDTGDMLLRREVPIASAETSEDLYPKLSQIGAEVMIQTLQKIESGSIVPEKQDHSVASLAPILTREDGCDQLLAKRQGNLRSLARLSALARRLDDHRRQKAAGFADDSSARGRFGRSGRCPCRSRTPLRKLRRGQLDRDGRSAA